MIRGNSAILKCSIPSYIAEFVTVEAWIREDGEVYIPEDPAVGQGTVGFALIGLRHASRCIFSAPARTSVAVEINLSLCFLASSVLSQLRWCQFDCKGNERLNRGEVDQAVDTLRRAVEFSKSSRSIYPKRVPLLPFTHTHTHTHIDTVCSPL